MYQGSQTITTTTSLVPSDPRAQSPQPSSMGAAPGDPENKDLATKVLDTVEWLSIRNGQDFISGKDTKLQTRCQLEEEEEEEASPLSMKTPCPAGLCGCIERKLPEGRAGSGSLVFPPPPALSRAANTEKSVRVTLSPSGAKPQPEREVPGSAYQATPNFPQRSSSAPREEALQVLGGQRSPEARPSLEGRQRGQRAPRRSPQRCRGRAGCPRSRPPPRFPRSPLKRLGRVPLALARLQQALHGRLPQLLLVARDQPAAADLGHEPAHKAPRAQRVGVLGSAEVEGQGLAVQAPLQAGGRAGPQQLAAQRRLAAARAAHQQYAPGGSAARRAAGRRGGSGRGAAARLLLQAVLQLVEDPLAAVEGLAPQQAGLGHAAGALRPRAAAHGRLPAPTAPSSCALGAAAPRIGGSCALCRIWDAPARGQTTDSFRARLGAPPGPRAGPPGGPPWRPGGRGRGADVRGAGGRRVRPLTSSGRRGDATKSPAGRRPGLPHKGSARAPGGRRCGGGRGRGRRPAPARESAGRRTAPGGYRRRLSRRTPGHRGLLAAAATVPLPASLARLSLVPPSPPRRPPTASLRPPRSASPAPPPRAAAPGPAPPRVPRGRAPPPAPLPGRAPPIASPHLPSRPPLLSSPPNPSHLPKSGPAPLKGCRPLTAPLQLEGSVPGGGPQAPLCSNGPGRAGEGAEGALPSSASQPLQTRPT
ncbi:gametogenetin-like [Petaurus breviceps papuanus]|uniref:gametogenetin-like n=1 Tax=Petaurus breviceps papuanus TaxID=3040969 RepID=UPI0036DDA28F